MYCRNCGQQIDDNALVCPHCGVAQREVPTVPYVKDEGGFLWALLGFCVPLVGLILYLVWKDEKPLTARSAGKGALVSVIIGALFYILAIGAGITSSIYM